MALTLSSAALFTASLLLAVAALFWPQLETLYLQSQPHGVSKGNGTKCPLGYEGTLPANHPPIGSHAAAKTAPAVQGATQSAAAHVAGAPLAQEVVGISSEQPQYVFVNGNIWTANPQIRWASSVFVDIASGEITQLRGPPSAGNCVQPHSSSSSSSSAANSCSAGLQDFAADVPPGSTVVDLQGAFVMPAFVDPHVHLVMGGLTLSQVDLRGAHSREEVAARIAAAAAAAPDGGWVTGWGWVEVDWGGGMPDATWIDEAAGSHPVFLTRMDGHMALVNTVAMQRANLGECCGCGAQPGGSCMPGVDTDESGRPTGLLREHAMDLVRSLVPAPDVQQRKAALMAAGRYLLSRGVTSVGDMGWGLFGSEKNTWEDLEHVYDAAVAEGDMPVRVSSYVPLRTWQKAAARLSSKGSDHHASGRLVWGGVKEFADGSLGSSTAVMWRPYVDSNCSNTGMRAIELDDLQELVEAAHRAGLQIAVHAIGDRALDEVLEIFEQLEECEVSTPPSAAAAAAASQRQPGGCKQHRIEHVQHISSAVSAAKLSVLNLHAVPNPQHLISDRAILVPKLGWERAGAGHTHAYKTLASMGVSIGFASDWPVVSIDPWASVYAAVFRTEPPEQVQRDHFGPEQGLAGGMGLQNTNPSKTPQPPPRPPSKPWAPEEKMPLEDVLIHHTHTAATVARLDAWVGQLRPGLRGDFVVLDRSPFEGLGVDGGEGFGAGLPRVLRTYMDGRCVYGCEGWDDASAASSGAGTTASSSNAAGDVGSISDGSSSSSSSSSSTAAGVEGSSSKGSGTVAPEQLISSQVVDSTPGAAADVSNYLHDSHTVQVK